MSYPVELLRHRLTRGLGKAPELTVVGSHRDPRAALQPGRTDMWDRRNGHGPGYEGPQTLPLRKIAENRVGMVHPRDQGLRIANR